MTSLYRSVIFLLSVATIQVQGGKDGLDQPELQSGSQSPTQQANYGCFRFNLVRRITRPIRLPQKESKHHLRQEEKEEKYSEFVECESKYLESEYDYVKEPSKNRYGENIQVTTIDSDGSQVLLKTIEKENTVFYKLESTPPPKTHMAEIGNEDGRYTSRECKLPEPFNLMLPYEIEMQKHLTQPDYGSPYVLEVVDYAVTKKEYVLVMKYPGKDWIALDRYMREEGKRSVYEVRFIAMEMLKALLSLKSLGVAHGNIAAKNILYDEKTSKLKLMNFDHSGLLEEWNQGSSASGSSEDKPDAWGTEETDLAGLGKLIYYLVTSKSTDQIPMTRQETEEKLREDLRNPESQIAIDVMDVVPILFGQGPYKMATLKNALKHPFFSRQ